ncbi:MAG: transketolase [Paracoccaceae bacterium]
MTVTPNDMSNAIRALTMDAVQNANSGHPGMPMGMAEMGLALWKRHLRHNPANPNWLDRDRFVLSNGHGSMLLYSLLHLTGYDLSMDDIKAFRTLHSKTPGHPERGYTPGVETTTGPLGQGVANAVGMAMAEVILAGQFNTPNHKVIDHRTFVFLGDGCLMEGVSHEACSLAGTLGLGKLIALYDDNGISIDGDVEGWFTDNTPDRFRAYGWHVIEAVDGHDTDAVDRAIAQAKNITDRPSLICCKTTIGQGAPTKAGSHDSHGSPLGDGEIAATREAIGWPHPPFVVPSDIAAAWSQHAEGATLEAEWQARFEAYAADHPDLARNLLRVMAGELPDSFAESSQAFIQKVADANAPVATRKISLEAITYFSDLMPELVGGSADLASSNLTNWAGMQPLSNGAGGNYVYFGVREFGMAAIMNGMAGHGGIRPYGATYLTFSDYSRNAIRMAALMKLGAVHVMTHDSLALGQDGPTHQPIEHLASLRMIPGLDLWRPCDGAEAAVAWSVALENTTKPTVLALSRQGLTVQPRDAKTHASIRRGGYVLLRETGDLKVIILATGSEVEIATQAAERLGDGVRVVSLPSTHVFDQQSLEWRNAVLPNNVPMVSIEAGTTQGWHRYIGRDGIAIGLDSFGESAAADVLYDHFGLTVDAVIAAVERIA